MFYDNNTKPTDNCMENTAFTNIKFGGTHSHPLLVQWSWKGRAIPLLPLWVVRPVESLSACTRVTFTFTFYTLVANHWAL